MSENTSKPVELSPDRVEPVLLVLAKANYNYMKSEEFTNMDESDQIQEAWAIAEAMNLIANQQTESK